MDELNALKTGFLQGRTIKVLDQVGKPKSVVRDKGRKAKLPGKRVSASGNVYWETRANRSDALNSNV